MRAAVAIAALALAGCSPTLTGAGHNLGAGLVSSVTDSAARDDVSKLTADAAKSATAAARDELLGPDTEARAKAIVTDMGAALRQQIDEALGASLRARVAAIVQAVLDEAAAEVPALRDQLVGEATRQDVDALIDEAAPHLAAAVQGAVASSLAPVKASADAEAAKWKPIAIGLGVGGVALLLALVAAVHVLWTHRKVIEALARRAV